MVVKGKKEKGVWNSYWRYRNCYLITARYHAVPATRTRGSAGWYGMARHAYQAYSVVKRVITVQRPHIPAQEQTLMTCLAEKGLKLPPRTVWKKSKLLACRHRDTRPRVSSTCSASNEANCARRRGNHHNSSEARAV